MTTTSKILQSINAPYAMDMSAHALAEAIVDMTSVEAMNAQVFSFFSEISPDLQEKFIRELGVDKNAAVAVAKGFQELAGYDLPLAA